MQTPTWAIVIGIFLLLFGSCEVSQSIDKINAPEKLKLQQEIMGSFAGGNAKSTIDSIANANDVKLDSANLSNIDTAPITEMAQTMANMFEMSDFTLLWTVRFGYIGLFVALLYILSGVFLFIKKPFAIPLVYIALIISIIFGIVQFMVLTSDTTAGFISKMSGFGNIFGIMIDIVFIIIVYNMDHTAYTPTSVNEV